jgi:hypothetical protein
MVYQAASQQTHRLPLILTYDTFVASRGKAKFVKDADL